MKKAHHIFWLLWEVIVNKHSVIADEYCKESDDFCLFRNEIQLK